jgi:hypothetical protein
MNLKAVGLLLGLILVSRSQVPLPSVSLSIPANIRSETVQIRYLMRGVFGGVGGYVTPKAGVSSYTVPASSDGKPATGIKIIAYAPCCDFVTMDLSLADQPNRLEPFVCKPLPSVVLSGRFSRALTGGHNAELLITYQAFWAHSFFGILDGAVTTFDVANVSPASDGTFRVEIPDFSRRNESVKDELTASLHLLLRDAKTWNHLATNLTPKVEELKTAFGLKIVSSYPANLEFVSGN